MEITTTKNKQTKEILIPLEWSVKKIKDISPLQRGFDLTSSELVKGKYPVVYSNGIGFYHSEYMIIGPGVIMGRSGTLGKIHYLSDNFWPHNTTLWVTNFFNNNPKFIYYLLQFVGTERFGSGSGVPTLNRNDVHDYKISIPLNNKEQKAIAQVLSDTDSLIEALEKKIAKKKLIKKGMMQKLLTPKEDWEVKTLGDFLDYEQPTNYVVESTEYNDNYDIPVLTAGKSFILGYTNEKGGIFENYPVIIFDDFTTATKFVDFPFKVKSSALKILKPKNKDVILGFIFEIMQQIDFPLGDHKRHWIGEFKPLEIMVPKSKSEQIYIAQILADMGQEIAQLEEKLSKYQLAKQGMMQQLLSGKTRLV